MRQLTIGNKTGPAGAQQQGKRDIAFAFGIVFILIILFLPIPPILIDIGLALSIAFSILILMVALWIDKPLDFSAFPTVLLIATLLRLSLNIASTRLILSNGSDGYNAAGNVIGGFSKFVMSGDFVIGIVVFVILVTVNFMVITKGATRIAEVGARFTLDAIPGKQMAIDADLSAGLIDEKEAQHRRRELEEESAFFGSMDGASKFVRGDAIAGLIITAVNIFGGIVIGVTRHEMPIANAADVFTKLSVGDGLVSQIPALVVSLAAGLLVAKGGTRGSAEKVFFDQFGRSPRAIFVAASLMFVLALTPGLPFLPFALLGGVMAAISYLIPKQLLKKEAQQAADLEAQELKSQQEEQLSVKESLKTPELELRLGKQLAMRMLTSQGELAHRVGKMRRRFARQYGFVVPEIRLLDDLNVATKGYEIRIHGTLAASEEMRLGDLLVIIGDKPPPDIPGDETREPAFGMKSLWISEHLADEARKLGFEPIDAMSVMLTHLSEVLNNSLGQLLSYKDMQYLFDRLDPEYRKLLDEVAPAQISHSSLQAVLKLLLSERVSVRNLHLILEAVAEIAPHVRRPEQIVEHVRMRMAPQICGDLLQDGKLKIMRLGARWDKTFEESLKPNPNDGFVEFDIRPDMIEEFGREAATAIRARMDEGHIFAVLTSPDARRYVQMILDRLFAALPVLSQAEIARGTDLEQIGSIS